MTSPVEKVTDHTRRTLDDLKSQFADSPIIVALTTAIGDEIQRFEDVAHDVLAKTRLANAEGVVLDTIGKLAGVQRLDRDDDDYRRIIQVAIAARDSDGGAEQIIWIASELVNAPVQYVRQGTAFFELLYESDEALSPELQNEAINLIDRAVPAGVAWRLVASLAEKTARYDDDTYGAARYATVVGGNAP